jgi:uncharacterized protein YjlB
MSAPGSEFHFLPDGGWCPNNPRLPVVIHRHAFEEDGEELATRFEETFARHGWPPAWRYTIFDYPHYHSTTHEVVGVYRGEGEVRFGDTVGFTARLNRGDVVLIPAGVSHERLRATEDFHAVGAYPENDSPDEQRLERNDREGSLRRIAALPLPEKHPLTGDSLRKVWAASCGNA